MWIVMYKKIQVWIEMYKKIKYELRCIENKIWVKTYQKIKYEWIYIKISGMKLIINYGLNMKLIIKYGLNDWWSGLQLGNQSFAHFVYLLTNPKSKSKVQVQV